MNTSEVLAERDWLTTGQVARRLKVDPKTVLRRIWNGDIPAIQFGDGGRWLIPKTWLDQWLTKSVVRRKWGKGGNP